MTEPQVGQVWRERRKQYRNRTVRIDSVDDAGRGGFVYVVTLTGYLGEPITRQRKPTRVRRSLWARYWEPA